MKVKIFILVCIVSVVCMCGCMQNSNEDNVKENDMDMKEVVLTEEEEKILCELYADEERIKEGKLYSYQEECLKQIRYAKEYLSKKYPKNEFEILSCNPQNKMNSSTQMMFREVTDLETVYDLAIEIADNEYCATDNYYGVLIREKYDLAVEELIQNELKIDCKTYTYFNHLQGEEINGSLTVEKIFELGSRLGRDTNIFLEEEQLQEKEISSSLQTLMKKNNLYGSYNVYIGAGILKKSYSGKELSEYVQKQIEDEIQTEYFNCFELD